MWKLYPVEIMSSLQWAMLCGANTHKIVRIYAPIQAPSKTALHPNKFAPYKSHNLTIIVRPSQAAVVTQPPLRESRDVGRRNSLRSSRASLCLHK